MATLHDLHRERRKVDAVIARYFVEGMALAAMIFIVGFLIGRIIEQRQKP